MCENEAQMENLQRGIPTMRKGFGTITCGKCKQKIPVIWMGEKFKMPCPRCRSSQTVTNTRLKKFQPLKEDSSNG